MRKNYLASADLKNYKNIGLNVMIHKLANIVGEEHISIGNNVRIDPYVSIIASAPVTLGSFVHIGSYSYLSAREKIIIDDYSNISQYVAMYTASDDYSGEYMTNPMVPDEYTNTFVAPIHLNKHVILGSGTIIMPGCIMGEGCAVGAKSFVKKSTMDWSVYAGVPAKKIKNRSKNLLQIEKRMKK